VKEYRIRRSQRASHRTPLRMSFWHGAGCEEADSEPGLEGCGLRAKCGNRGRRTRLQWRLRRLRCAVPALLFAATRDPRW
jgi:hypothetical protein